MNLVTIDDDNYQEHISPVVDGEKKLHGLVPRNFDSHPVGCFANAPALPDKYLIPRGEWKDRLVQQKSDSARLIEVRNRGKDGGPFPSLDQNGKGYCWAHSSTSAITFVRAIMGLPYVQLSAYAVACKIKNFKDEGGFGAQSAQFIAEKGVPSAEFWPLQSMNKANDNSKTWANAKENRFLEFHDLDPQAENYLDQFVSCLLHGWVLITDFNWWGHSVCTFMLEELGMTWEEITSWILNSWSDKWSQKGAGMLKGKKARPDACLVAKVATASAA